MQSIIFIFYFLVFIWLITIIPFFKNAGINKWILIFLFSLKIAAGFAYARFYSLPQNIAVADTWKYYNNSLTETAWLLRDPVAFIKDLFYSHYQQSSNLFSGVSSYWNDLKDNVFVKLMAVINVFTGKSYYTNILVFNFLYFFGPVALYRMTKPYWKDKKTVLLLPVFILPSFLFWCSGLHKDGLIFSATMLSTYCFQKQVIRHRFLWKELWLMLAVFTLLFALRNTIFLLLLPALAAFFFSERMPRYKWIIFTGMYSTSLFLFFILPHISSTLNFPQYIISKQAEFNVLTGNSKVTLPPLAPEFTSFAKFFPYATDLIFFRPHISEVKGISYMLSFLENTFIFIIILICIFFHKPIKNMSPLELFLLFFSLSVLLLYGYTVTFTGAIVRYKSIVMPLLCTFLFLNINIQKLPFQKLIK